MSNPSNNLLKRSHFFNRNRFQLDGSIKDVTISSKVIYIFNNQSLEILQAVRLARINWEHTLAPSTMLFIVAHDFEGEIIVNDATMENSISFEISKNYLFLEKETQTTNEFFIQLQHIIHKFSKKEYKTVVKLIDNLVVSDFDISRVYQFKLQVLRARAFYQQRELSKSLEIIDQAIDSYSDFNNGSLDKKQIEIEVQGTFIDDIRYQRFHIEIRSN